MHKLYQENIDQVLTSSAKNCEKTLNFWTKWTKKIKVGEKIFG